MVTEFKCPLKGALRSSREEIQIHNLNIYIINEVIITQKYIFFHNWIKQLVSEDNMVPEHCLMLERWQGPPHINKVKQCEMLSSFKVSLFIQFNSVIVLFFFLFYFLISSPHNTWCTFEKTLALMFSPAADCATIAAITCHTEFSEPKCKLKV